MVESGFAERVLLGTRERPVTGADLGRLVRAGASTLNGYEALVYAGENHPLLPVALFSAAWAGIPFVPVKYRLEDQQLNALVARQQGALVLADAATAPRISGDAPVLVFDGWLAALPVAPTQRGAVRRQCGGDRVVHERYDVETEGGAAPPSASDGVSARFGRVR
jgi:hypothetical protein